ncbi:hypothetical protein B0H16DRAFT_1776361 [Mycena metata]|uniref:Uncharacterized protein n=1 Tax=Mycena metata TaxID=1033252 RepID=A0AAD7MRQ1_9AGAR|nr:hypothetical protein B0H16DRAFT_1776361 [Mycena metata]
MPPLPTFFTRTPIQTADSVNPPDIIRKCCPDIFSLNSQQIFFVEGKIKDITLPKGVLGFVRAWVHVRFCAACTGPFPPPGGCDRTEPVQMVLILCNPTEVSKDRASTSRQWWQNYYEAIVDVVDPETILSVPYTVEPVSSVEQHTKGNSFHLYFDTFFTIDGQAMTKDTEVKNIRENGAIPAEVCTVVRRNADSIATRNFHRVKS